MCGILGYLGKRDFPLEAFERALDTMAQRGPDDRGLHEEPAVLLGHRRLAILDLSAAGHQPMMTPDGRYVIVYNGEVYNFRELREPLEREGVRFMSESDTEVILALFARKGPACLDDLRGMFAIAIWDTLEKSLFLARDRMGIKPLYVWRFPGGVAFGSEVRALQALPGGPAEVEPEAVAQYLMWGSVPEPLTVASGVECLPPATWALWRNGTWSRTTYWEPPAGKPAFIRREEVVEALRPEIVEAVRLRCISDAPLGAFLSGGIDSSAVVGLMRAAGHEHLHTFSMSFPQTELDEASYALAVARQFDTRHTNVEVSEAMIREELDGFFAAMDQPTCDGMNTHLVSKFAKRGGLTVSLSGLGGDELFAGYASFRRARALEPWLRHAPRWPLGVAAGAAARWRKLSLLALPAPATGRLYAASRCLFTPAEVRRLLAPDVLSRTSLSHEAGGVPGLVPTPASTVGAVHGTMELELRRYMHNQLLRDSDVFGMAHSLEIRVPLIDHKIAEILFRTHPDLIVGGGQKALLLDALPRPLPRECTHRKKMGFTFPFARWMRGPWTFLPDALRSTAGGRGDRRTLDAREAARTWTRFADGELHWSRPWSLYVLERFLQRDRDHLLTATAQRAVAGAR